jgi:fatty acid desaturase
MSLATLRRELEPYAIDKKATVTVLAELCLHLLVTAAGILLASLSARLWVQGLGLLLATLGSMGVATNTHTSSHKATSEHAWLNDLLTYFGYPLFSHLSATYWWRNHFIHHGRPNVLGVDEDADLAPWFLLTDDELRRARPHQRRWARVQWIALPLALALNDFNFQKNGWTLLIRRLRRPDRQLTHFIDLACLVLHWVLWLILPSLIFPFSHVLLFYVLRTVGLGFMMFALLAPAHLPAAAVCLDRTLEHPDFLLKQTVTTLDFRTGFYGRLLAAGLDHQIEHHLFPRVSHTHYRKIRPLVEEFCRRHGYPYRRPGWAQAVWQTLRVFHRPKPVCRSPRELEEWMRI